MFLSEYFFWPSFIDKTGGQGQTFLFLSVVRLTDLRRPPARTNLGRPPGLRRTHTAAAGQTRFDRACHPTPTPVCQAGARYDRSPGKQLKLKGGGGARRALAGSNSLFCCKAKKKLFEIANGLEICLIFIYNFVECRTVNKICF